jgi:Glycosyl hydrolase family 20, domain 2/beta-N-acetylglucosaminidase
MVRIDTKGQKLMISRNRQFKVFFLSLMFIAMLLPTAFGADSIQKNGDFEKTDAKGRPTDWVAYKTYADQGIEVVADPAHKGKKMLRIWSKAGAKSKAGVRSDFLKATPKALYKLSLRAKLQNVRAGGKSAGSQALATFEFLDAKKKRIRIYRALGSTGTRDWLIYKTEATAPDNAATILVKLMLLRAEGEMWVDDVSLSVEGAADETALLPPEETGKNKEPVIIPTPQYCKPLGTAATLINVCRVSSDDAHAKRPMAELKEFLKSLGIRSIPADQKNAPPASVEIRIVSTVPPALMKKIPAAYADAAKRDQGYVLISSPKSILIAARTPAGAFYGVQTLRQLAEDEKTRIRIPCVIVADYPTIPIRGIVGAGPWFKTWAKGKTPKGDLHMLDRCARLKLNLIRAGGSSWNNGAFTYRMSEPLSEREKRDLSRMVVECKKRFITFSAGFKPTTPTDWTWAKKMKYPNKAGFDYLDEKAFARLFAKLDAVCDLGVRRISFDFDDIRYANQHILHDPRHKKRFGSVGNAHAYLIKRCYDHLTKKYPGIVIQICPTYYTDPLRGGPIFDKYLPCLAKLPKEIEFICVAPQRDACERFKELTGRAPSIWNNYLAHFGKRKGSPALVPPFKGGGADIAEYTSGYYVFLPMGTPGNEDYKALSWFPAADFLWNPAVYKPKESYARVIRKYMPPELLTVLREYSAFKDKMFLGQPMPNYPVFGKTKAERIAYCKSIQTKLNADIKTLKSSEPGKLRDSLLKEYAEWTRGWGQILNITKELPFPVKVPQYRPKAGASEKTLRANSVKVSNMWLVLGKKGNGPFGAPEAGTRFYLSHDKRNLYVTAYCDEPKMGKLRTKVTQRDKDVFMDDCVEVFLGSDVEKIFDYVHVVTNSAGVIMDGSVGTGGAGKVEFDDRHARVHSREWTMKGVKSATGKGKNLWWAQLTIPLRSVGVKSPKIGTRLRFNLCRERYAGKTEISGYARPMVGFHVPERFETLELIGSK